MLSTYWLKLVSVGYRRIDSNHDLPIAENVLNRRFSQMELNRAWVSDINVPQQAA